MNPIDNNHLENLRVLGVAEILHGRRRRRGFGLAAAAALTLALWTAIIAVVVVLT